MNYNKLCPPAFIYIIFSLIQVVIDISEEEHTIALVKLVVGVIFTFMLQILCDSGLDVISWIVVFIPFILKSVVVGFIIMSMNLHPNSLSTEEKDTAPLDVRERSLLEKLLRESKLHKEEPQPVEA